MSSLARAAFVFGAVAWCAPAAADDVPQPLPFAEAWTDGARLDANNDWSKVPGITGHRGNALTEGAGVDPQTVLADGGDDGLHVRVDLNNPTSGIGGIGEFEGADPIVAMQAHEVADAPHLRIALDTTAAALVRVVYDLVDVDPGDDVQASVALHYRVGDAGPYTNVPRAFVEDATQPEAAGLRTRVDVILPADAAGAARLELRILATNQEGADEWIGVDDLAVTASVPPGATATAAPATVIAGDTLTVTVAVTPGAEPDAAGFTVVCDATPVGGPPEVELEPLEGLAFRGAIVAGAAPAGLAAVPCVATDELGREAKAVALVEVLAVCGDGRVESAEACDDGDGEAGDGCAACAVEAGWWCSGSPSSCHDIDECAINRHDCDSSEICVNEPGGWSCVATPDAGAPDAGVEPDAAAPATPDAGEPPPRDGGCHAGGGGLTGVAFGALALALAQLLSSRMRRAAMRRSS